MEAKFDVQTREMTLPDLASRPFGGAISAIVVTYGQTVPVGRLRVTVTGHIESLPVSLTYPDVGVTIKQMAGGGVSRALVRWRFDWRPGDEVDLLFALEAGPDTLSERVQFIAPEPAE
jgi:hypothetical protein